MAQAQVLLGIKGKAKQQARTGGWDKGVLGKANHAREMRKIHSSHSMQGDSSCGGGCGDNHSNFNIQYV